MTISRSAPLQPCTHALARRRFGLLLPWAGLALLSACSKDPEPAPAAPEPAPPAAPAAAPAEAAATSPSPADSGGSTAAMPMVDPADPSVAALAYTPDASQVVAANNPKYQPGQACANCALYAGQPGDAAGPCPLYAGRRVNAIAWCNAYVKKTG